MKLVFFPLFLILFFVSGAFAQTAVTMYVRTDCANNGDGTGSGCAASIGAAGANTTLGNAHAKAKTNYASGLAVANVLMTFDCAGTTADTSEPVIDIVSDATRFVHVYIAPANRAVRLWDTSKYRITSNNKGLNTRTWKIKVTGLQSESVVTGSGNYGGFSNYYTADSFQIDVRDSIFRYNGTCAGGTCAAAYWYPQGSGATAITWVNNITYVVGGTNTAAGVLRGQGAESNIIYNNTFYGGTAGASALTVDCNGASAALYLKNNVFQNPGAAAAYFSSGTCSTLVTANNVTNDTSSPNVSYRSKTCSYVNTTSGTENFTLQSGDTNCKDAGTSLTADAQLAFSADQAGVTRPQGAAWDIGALEYIAAVLNGSLTTLKVSGAL